MLQFISLICALFLISGCGKAKDKSVVLIYVGNEKITVADFEERISNLPEQYQNIVKKRKEEYLEELVNDMLLYQEARRKGLSKDKDVQKVIEEAKRKILIARLLKDNVDDAITITEERINEFYNGNKDKYMTAEIMRVSHILVPTRFEAQGLLEELKKGKVFEEIARAKSVDPTAQKGGDIGYFPKGQLLPEFENACSKLEIGQISDVVKTDLGYHIIKLTDRRPPKERPIADVKDDIRFRLRTIERRKIFNELLNKLRKDANIVINKDALGKE